MSCNNSPHPIDPAEVRALHRAGLDAPTACWTPSHARAHLVAVPVSWAHDLSLYCAQNRHALPVLDIGAAGGWTTRLAAGADLRTDLARYRVWRDGELVDEPPQVTDHWLDDLVAFLLGRPVALDADLAAAGVPLRHVEQGQPVPQYVTNRSCRPAGRLNGPLVVAMRPVPAPLVAATRTARGAWPLAPVGPLHTGDPEALGIRALSCPDFGGRVRPAPGDVPVFWASGVTAQAALMSARPPFAITEAPGHPLITDLPSGPPLAA
ncbi:D-glutamate cyclase family protein [Streptomyces sp. CA-250714]|uniref:D-glutamate cyclase family protein n=1 Tax=Streptomyces sp. CA-250714 TaxID=3240060 RepID=UPI003D8C3C30